MEQLSGNVGADSIIITEHLKTLIEKTPDSYPRNWLPQANFDELMSRADREPIHLHPSIHHLHRRWDMTHTRKNIKKGYGPRAVFHRILDRMVTSALGTYLNEEQDFRAALARSIDAVAYRIDEVASADMRNVLDVIRNDLIDLARYTDEKFESAHSEITEKYNQLP